MSQQQQPSSQQSSLQNAQQPQHGSGSIFATRNCLPHEVREESIQSLNQVLADAITLQIQCKSAHWNVKGENFYQLHELFEDVAGMLEGYVDEVAERVTALGGLAEGTVPVVAQSSGLPEFPIAATDQWSVLENVANSLASFDATLQMQTEAASQRGDLDTADLLNELSRDVSKSLWFVEAHLQGQGSQHGSGQQSQQRVDQQQGQRSQRGQQPGAQPTQSGQQPEPIAGQH